MTPECLPISTLPHLSRLFLDYAGGREPLAPYFAASPYSREWMRSAPALDGAHRQRLAELLLEQNRGFAAGPEVLAGVEANIERLRNGAAAVVTGQQVALLGGPLFTLLKAATAIRLAQEATAAGHPHVPIFWMATEDHDLPEADHVVLPSRHELHTLRIDAPHHAGEPVGGVRLGQGIAGVLDEAAGLLDPGPLAELIESCYRPDATFAHAFGRLISAVFADFGLIVIDASTRAFHALGAEVLRRAIVDAGPLHHALLERGGALTDAGYHAQVLVAETSSLLFLIENAGGARVPLRRTADGAWQAGKQAYSDADLLAILDREPERLSPNALLRPVFQDSLLPTSAYIGGPAEIAYFAQTQVLYEQILGRATPVLPRLSATLVEPAAAAVLARHEIGLPDLMASTPDELAQRLGARTMPVEGKRKLAAAGNALEEELAALTEWLRALDANLGRSADVSASKMRYQMNRLRRLAANFQLQRDQSLRRQVDALYLSLFPDRHPQERVLGAAWFLARYGERLPALLVESAGQECPGHRVIYL